MKEEKNNQGVRYKNGYIVVDDFEKDFVPNIKTGNEPGNQIVLSTYAGNISCPEKAEHSGNDASSTKLAHIALKSLVATAGAVATMLLTNTVKDAAPTLEASFDLSATDTTITYTVTFPETLEGEYEIHLYNPFTQKVNEISVDGSQGVFEDLKPGMEYTLVVQSVDGKIKSQKASVTTKKTSEIEQINVSNGKVNYKVFADDDGLNLWLYNDKGRQIVPLNCGQNTGSFTITNQDESYELAIKDSTGILIIDSEKVC